MKMLSTSMTALCALLIAATPAARAAETAAAHAHHETAKAAPGNDAAAIRQLLSHTFDKPGTPALKVEPLVVAGAHALVGWVQGERGGRALLQRNSKGEWQVTVCAGDGLKDPNLLQQAGVPNREASAMITGTNRAESRLPAATLAKFASFEGLVRMDGHGHSH
ncbi:MAG: hypothetical protein RJA44_2647 [Pseudomonadota bacterium]|jgi:hypothetical protein